MRPREHYELGRGHKAEATLLSHTSTRLFQHQHYKPTFHDTMTVQTSSLHLRNASSSSIWSLILAILGRIMNTVSTDWVSVRLVLGSGLVLG